MQVQSMIELLESRRMFAGVSVRADIVRIYGDEISANVITVANDTSGLNVEVSIEYTDALAIAHTYTALIPKTLEFRKINIYGGAGADSIAAGNVGVYTRTDAKAGDDTVVCGGQRDAVFAGPGNDTVGTASGDDLVYGEAGNDVLRGGAGNDTVLGGSGQNDIGGGKGDDTIGGLLGAPNTLFGGAGADTFITAETTITAPNDFNALEDSLAGSDESDTDTPTVTPLPT